MPKYDVIVSGGGMVGTTMALALGKNPVFKHCKIALIEANPKKTKLRRSREYSNRVSAINPSSKELFNKLGVWERFTRFQSVTDMKVWGAYTEDVINYADEYRKTKEIAYIVENDQIVDALMDEIERLQNVDVLYETKITKVETASPNVEDHVITNNGDQCKFDLLIGADGANSGVRKAVGGQYLSYNYNHTGVVATLKIMEQDNTTAWQRFLPSGPIALLPLDNETSSLVWSTTQEHAKSLLKLPSEYFVDAVNEAVSSKPLEEEAVSAMQSALLTICETKKLPSGYPHVIDVAESSRAAFPLGFGHATRYVRPKLAIIGDAAHRVHPLAGQGVNLGFRDVINLNTHLTQGLLAGRALGDIYDLKNYEQESQRVNLPIMIAIDMIYRVYTSEFGLVRALGSLGIKLTEGIYPIKNLMRNVASS